MSSRKKTLVIKKKKGDEKSAFDIIEEAVYLLRNHAIQLLPLYYIGTMPFVIALVVFINDMSHGVHNRQETANFALLVAGLYLLKNLFQSLFCRSIISRLCGSEDELSIRTFCRIFVYQNIVQVWALILLPIAAVLMFPIGWTVGFFYGFMGLPQGGGVRFRELLRKGGRQAVFWPRQNHYVLIVVTVLGIMILLNMGIIVFIVPWLLKTFLGIETTFSRIGGLDLMLALISSSTFWSVIFAMTYLLLDPVMKAIYSLRVFYGEAQTTGDDLLMEFRRLADTGKTFVALIIFATAMSMLSFNAVAKEPAADKSAVVDAKKLDDAIKQTLDKRIYKWRLPPIKSEKVEQKNLLAVYLRAFFENIEELLDSVFKWLEDLLDSLKYKENNMQNMSSWNRFLKTLQENLTYLSIGVLILISLIAVYIYIRYRRRKRQDMKTTADIRIVVPDLNDETLTADELEQSEWLKIAAELMAKGEKRLAMRAIFLAAISALADKNVLTVAKFKSNREYYQELERRYHNHPESVDAFAHSITIFEQVWYGDYTLSDDLFGQFKTNFEQITGMACQI